MENVMADLLHQAKAGSQAAFDTLLKEYDPLIQSMTERYAAEGEAEDIRQEAIIAFYHAVLSYDSSMNHVTFGLYAKVCIRNRIISHIRKLQNASVVLHPCELPESGEPFLHYQKKMAEVQGHTVDPEQEAVDRESYYSLLKMINESLTPGEKDVFRLYIAGKPYKEIAALLNRTEKSVDNAVFRIKSKVKRLI